MRIPYVVLTLLLVTGLRPALAQDAISDRLGLARYIDEPTGFYGSVHARELFEAVETSRFWQKPLVRRALREIPPDALQAIESVLPQGMEEIGVWIPAASAEPLARLIALLPDGAAAALSGLSGNTALFEANVGRRERLLETLDKGVVPTFVAFNRVENAKALVDRTWEWIQKNGRFPPGVRALTRDGRVDLEVHIALVAMPKGVLETLRDLPLVRTLDEAGLARLKAACEATKIVVSLAAAGPYILASVGPDTRAIERLTKNLATPPAVELTLLGSPAVAALRADMEGAPTVVLGVSDSAGATAMMMKELDRSLTDLKLDLTAHQRELAVRGAPVAMLQALKRGETMLAQFETYLKVPDTTTGRTSSILQLDGGLRATSRIGLVSAAESGSGGDALVSILPREVLAFVVTAKSAAAAEVPGFGANAVVGNLETQVDDLVAAGTLAPEQAAMAKRAIGTMKHLMEQYAAKVEPSIGEWSALAATASGTLEVPKNKLSVPIPELAFIVQMSGDEGVRAWWTDAVAQLKALLAEVAPTEKINLPDPTMWEHQGVAIAGYDVPALAGGFSGDVVPNAFFAKQHLVFSTSLRLSRSIIDRLQGGAGSVKDRPGYAALAAGIYARPAFDTRVFADLAGWVGYAQRVTDIVIAQQGYNEARLKGSLETSDAVFDTLRVFESLGASHGREGDFAVTRAWLRVRD